MYEDIYEFQFKSLFQKVYPNISIVPRRLKQDSTGLKSSSLFDIVGDELSFFKSINCDYKYWTEVYILKIIKTMLERKGIKTIDNYYENQNEQHSLTIIEGTKKVEAYFLFDITYGEENRTNYDRIINQLTRRAKDDIDSIHIYLLQEYIDVTDLAYLIYQKGDDDFVKLYMLNDLFVRYFSNEEYYVFKAYAKKYRNECFVSLSYTTSIVPTTKIIAAFKERKKTLFKSIDYRNLIKDNNKNLEEDGKSALISDLNIELAIKQFVDNEMYLVMIGNSDFADSFISAEWMYDVYLNKMGELELTGIVAGYLKSIEQLLFKITSLHKNEGFKIRSKEGKFIFYTTENEESINNMLESLINFITFKRDDRNIIANDEIRSYIEITANSWRKKGRNGYFHKDNLYDDSGKIEKIRSFTILLYFLFLGSINFTNEQLQLLGICAGEKELIKNEIKNELYTEFEEWIDKSIKYNRSSKQNIAICSKGAEKMCLSMYYTNNFSTNDYSMWAFPYNVISCNHVEDLPDFNSDFKGEDEDIFEILFSWIKKYYSDSKYTNKIVLSTLTKICIFNSADSYTIIKKIEDK